MKEKEILSLIDKAINAREKAYAPYSKFYVGAVVLDDKNNFYIGANIENGSYGLTNCAERTAIFTAKVNGMNRIKAIAIVGDTSGPVSPCGACRQVISEFADENTLIILANLNKDYKLMNIDELIPYRFKL